MFLVRMDDTEAKNLKLKICFELRMEFCLDLPYDLCRLGDMFLGVYTGSKCKDK